MDRISNNRCFIHLKIVGELDEALCFQNIEQLNVRTAIKEIKKYYKFHKMSYIYLVEEQYEKELREGDQLVHGRTYVCKRKESKRITKH